jgi:hypothetical protein
MVARMSGRPSPAVIRAVPASVQHGTPATIACSTEKPARSAGARPCRFGPGRDAIRHVGRRALGFANDDDEPDVQCRVIDGDRVEALADLEGNTFQAVVEVRPAGSAAQLQPGAAEDQRPMGVVLKSVSESTRPATWT